MSHAKTIITIAARDFIAGHFIRIASAMTIHREDTSVAIRDVFGALVRTVMLIGLFADLPNEVLAAGGAVLVFSLMLRIVDAWVSIVTLQDA